MSGPPIPIRMATTSGDVASARALFEEYAEWLAVDLCFQGFAEELATLPGAYAPPHGMLLLAGQGSDAVGCIALRPLADSAQQMVAEVKRLYVRPSARGTGLGRRLVQSVIDGARAIGYRELKLDTLAQMRDAQALYARLGFRECEPYYVNPIPGTVYMSLTM
ncbi:MAG TPA: GNAT family N-acetyltransferase [Casimicrobiaceae bacterium]|nr:GNAT family N-acetyltransferase [Casimicrobiaceae bacterium]